MASAICSRVTPGVDAGDHELPARRIGLEDAQIGDHRRGAAPAQAGALARVAAVEKAGRGDEIQPLHERPRVVAQDDQHLACEIRDLGRAAGAGQPHLGPAIGSDHRGVEVGEAVDLGGAEKADVDAPALQPIAEDLWRRDHRVRGRRQIAVADRERQHVGLGADRPRLVDQDHVGRVGQAREIGGGRGQADADEADGAVLEPARRGDRHHLRGRERQIAHRPASVRMVSPSTRMNPRKSSVSSTCLRIQSVNVSRLRATPSQAW